MARHGWLKAGGIVVGPRMAGYGWPWLAVANVMVSLCAFWLKGAGSSKLCLLAESFQVNSENIGRS